MCHGKGRRREGGAPDARWVRVGWGARRPRRAVHTHTRGDGEAAQTLGSSGACGDLPPTSFWLGWDHVRNLGVRRSRYSCPFVRCASYLHAVLWCVWGHLEYRLDRAESPVACGGPVGHGQCDDPILIIRRRERAKNDECVPRVSTQVAVATVTRFIFHCYVYSIELGVETCVLCVRGLA